MTFEQHPGLRLLTRYASVEAAVEALAKEAGPVGDVAWLTASLLHREDKSETPVDKVPNLMADAADSENDISSDCSTAASDAAADLLWQAQMAGDEEVITSWRGDERVEHEVKRLRKVGWSKDEDATILSAVGRMGTQWQRIAELLIDRTPDAVRNRWHRLQKSNKDSDTEPISPKGVDGGASPAADENAEQYIKGAGHGRSMWTAEEDQLIIDGVNRLGCKWRKVASALPGRSDSSVRNRWMRLQKEWQKQPVCGPAADAPTAAALVRPTSAMEVLGSTGEQQGGNPALVVVQAQPVPPAAFAATPPAWKDSRAVLKRRASEAFATNAVSSVAGGEFALGAPPLAGFGIDMLVSAVQ